MELYSFQYIHTDIYIYIYILMIMDITINFKELCFQCELKNSKILIARYGNVHKF